MKVLRFKKTYLLVAAAICLSLLSSCMHRYYAKKYAEHKKNEMRIIGLVKDWIRNNAKYPESYIPISYSDLEETSIVEPRGRLIKIMRTVPNSECLRIQHTYTINDVLADSKFCESLFIFDTNYQLLGCYTTIDNSKDISKELFIDTWKLKFGK